MKTCLLARSLARIAHRLQDPASRINAAVAVACLVGHEEGNPKLQLSEDLVVEMLKVCVVAVVTVVVSCTFGLGEHAHVDAGWGGGVRMGSISSIVKTVGLGRQDGTRARPSTPQRAPAGCVHPGQFGSRVVPLMLRDM